MFAIAKFILKWRTTYENARCVGSPESTFGKIYRLKKKSCYPTDSNFDEYFSQNSRDKCMFDFNIGFLI